MIYEDWQNKNIDARSTAPDPLPPSPTPLSPLFEGLSPDKESQPVNLEALAHD